MEPSTTPRSGSTRPFGCSRCSSRFTRLENLNRHIHSVHQETVRRPFGCPHCALTFTRSDLRSRHVKKTHPHKSHVQTRQAPLTRSNSPQLESTSFASQAPQRDLSWVFKLPFYISIYGTSFHPILPLLHWPTVEILSTKEPLLLAIACIGSTHQCGAQSVDRELGLEMFENGLEALNRLTRDQRRAFREVWVLQAYLLFEYYALYSCQDGLFNRALDIHRRLVDAVREFEILQDGNLSIDTIDETEEAQWSHFIKQESLRRAIYVLYYLDSQLSITCNQRPLLSALEIKHQLPSPEITWSAPNFSAWSQINFEMSSSNMNDKDDMIGNEEPRPANGGMYDGLLQLMQPSNDVEEQLGLLWHSPFAALVLVMQLQMITRDLTHGHLFFYDNLILNRPPGIPSRRRLSIISEDKQCQILEALHRLADLMPKKRAINLVNNQNSNEPSILQDEDSSPSRNIMWHSVWIAWHYTAMSLTHPDSLLSTGVVEYSLPASLSTLLELGRPRAKPHRDIYSDKDVLCLADHLEQVIDSLNFPPNLSSRPSVITEKQEDPFTSILAFKVFLMGWRIIRLMSLALKSSTQLEGSNRKPSIQNLSSLVIMERLMEAIDTSEGGPIESSPCHETMTFESRFLEWIKRTFRKGSVWPSSNWIGIILQEAQ